MVVIDEGLSVGLVHGIYVTDGLCVEDKREPKRPKLESPDDHFRLQVLRILGAVKRDAQSAPASRSTFTALTILSSEEEFVMQPWSNDR